jgi:FkbM family methyltransferase
VSDPHQADADIGHSDRTLIALLATRAPVALRPRFAPLLQRGDLAVLHGLAEGLRFPVRAVPTGHPHTRLLLLGDLEVPMQEALHRTVAPGSTVFDVGANIGFFSVLAGRLTGPGGRVVGFEPVPDVAQLARAAVARNGMAGHVAIRAQAVGATAGVEQLHVVGEASWSHLASRGRHPDTVATIDVEVVTLDGLLDAGPAPDVVKLDVEGAEVDAFRGATRLLEEHRPTLIVELHETNAEVADLLEDAGYALENLDGPEPVREAGPIRILARPTGRGPDR